MQIGLFFILKAISDLGSLISSEIEFMWFPAKFKSVSFSKDWKSWGIWLMLFLFKANFFTPTKWTILSGILDILLFVNPMYSNERNCKIESGSEDISFFAIIIFCKFW